MANQVVGSRGKYKYITKYNSPNYNGSATIDAIVIHHWGIDGQSFNNVINTLMTAQASAHYVLEDGKVACLIEPGLRAWHVANNDYQVVMQGVYDINSHTIGIECRPECTQGDVNTLCELIAELWCDYGVTPIYGHQEFMATACPGRYQNQLEDIWMRAKEIYDEINGITDESTESEDDWMAEFSKEDLKYLHSLCDNHKVEKCSDWAKKEYNKAIKAGITDGTRPQDVATRQEVACMMVRAEK